MWRFELARSRSLLLAGLAAVCSACGSSGSKDAAANAPVAQIAAIGYAASDSSGNVVFDVRSQSEVVLSGKSSIAADKPILSYLWEPQNAAARATPATIRDQSTIALTIPATTQAVDLVFRLTVRDSDGDSGTATATLHVKPALDSGRLLELIGSHAKLRVVAATQQSLSAGAPFTLSLKSRTTYTSRARTRNSVEQDVGEPVTGEWIAGTGSGADSAIDYRNPVFDFPVPAVDAQAITRMFQLQLPLAENKLLDPAFIDDTDVELIVTLDAPSVQSEGVLYVLDANGTVVARAANGGDGLPTQLMLAADQVEALRISGGGLENKLTAQAYYRAIDPSDSKTRLRDWLLANCFDPDAPDYGADAHAIYLNDYDLGFGRDMYFRASRPASCSSPHFASGDAAAIVMNYRSLEAATKKIGAFIAVAMEYKASARVGEPGLVSFYAFAPDEHTGAFRRVLSADFDGRGQKYLPGACTMCHGGRPLTPAADPSKTYDASAHIGGTFMPWDLESFLYSDTDSSYSRDTEDAALRQRYTRAAQEDQLKKLNQFVLATYGRGNPFQCEPGFEGPCELVQMWYGGPGLPSARFLDAQVSPGWKQGGPDGNPPEAEALYRDVFARNCRACHIQRVYRAGSAKDPQFLKFADFVRTDEPAWRQLILQRVFASGEMPAARLTMDRFWTRTIGGVTSGELLARHFGVALPGAPGQPIACIASEAGPSLSADRATRTLLQRNAVVSLSAACSSHVSTFEWTLNAPAGSRTQLVGARAAHAAFAPDRAGTYDIALRTISQDGQAHAELQRFAVVENKLPQAAANIPVTVDLRGSMSVDVLTRAAALGDGHVSVTAPVLVSGSGLSATVDFSARVVITASGTAGGVLRYTIVDADGDTSFGELSVSVAATLTANDATMSDVDAYGAQAVRPTHEFDLADLVAAQDQPVTLSIVSGPELQGRRDGRTGTVMIGACSGDTSRACVFYSPPRGAISLVGALQIGPNDRFTYRACFTQQPATCDTGSVSVRLRGRADFTLVANTQRQTCAPSCHENVQSGAWQLAAHATDKEAFCAIRYRQGTAPEHEDIGVAVVSGAAPEESLVFRKPQGLDNHGGGSVLGIWNAGGASDPRLTAIRDWLFEGGYLTNSSDQSCP